ncbi:MAG: SpoIVB peptidase [Bacilli bacterium]
MNIKTAMMSIGILLVSIVFPTSNTHAQRNDIPVMSLWSQKNSSTQDEPSRAYKAHRHQAFRNDITVIPGGQSIGVKLNAEGVLVVGHHYISTAKGKISPGEKSGICVGDTIVSLDGKPVKKMSDISQIVSTFSNESKTVDIEFKRKNVLERSELQPVFDEVSHSYRIGLYVKDSIVGIGTLSFIEPESLRYGALGHVISDLDTRQPMPVGSGIIVESKVRSIERGTQGNPGEKVASFSENTAPLGSISVNSPYGIFGKLRKQLQNGIYDEPMPVAFSNEVKEGKAQILTVIENSEVQAFDVEVVSSVPQSSPGTKGMVIRITDKTLLKKTGGIVQGMSGSPIIQNGKVIGAVTHVFVNDPSSGYGVHIEWMLHEAGVNLHEQEENKAS